MKKEFLLREGDRRNISPTEDLNALGIKTLCPSKNQIRGMFLSFGKPPPIMNIFKAFSGEGDPGLNFNRKESGPTIDDNVHLMPGFISPKITIGRQHCIASHFYKLGENERFKQSSPKRVRIQLNRLLNTKKGARKPGIVKIKFGHFNETFLEVVKVGLKQKNYKARFEHADPGTNGFMIDPAIIGQRRKVQKLACLRRADSEKSLKCAEVPNIFDFPDVSLKIRRDVAGVKVGRSHSFFVQAGVRPLIKNVV